MSAVTHASGATLPLQSLPDPGGTCSVGQLKVGPATWGPGYGAIGTTSSFVRIPLTNIGADCVLDLPQVLGVAAAAGPFLAVPVNDSGTKTASGQYNPSQTSAIRAGWSLSITVGDWWYSGAPLSSNPRPCTNAIAGVSRILFPVANGSLEVDLPTTFDVVCASPSSMTVGIDLTKPGG